MSDCRCADVHIGMEVVGKNWHPDCPEHGLESEWWSSPEQVAHREAQSIRLRELQAQAREARAKARSTDDHR